jgi:hypothetical protein
MQVQYNKMFTNIEKDSIIKVRDAIKSGLFKKEKSTQEKQDIIKYLHTQLCAIYEIPNIEILFDDSVSEVYGQFDILNNRIRVKNTSLVTYLHEFYHYRQHMKRQENTEDGARGWSISLYFLAAPRLCRSAIERGLIIHQKEFKE